MEAAGSTSERGIGWQALGFAVVGCAGVAILELWSESGSWVYQSFETAVTRLYWAFVVPLAALFDWGRRMFETRQEIRKAAFEKAVKKAVEKALEDKVRRISERAEALNIPREDVKKLLEVES